MLARFAPSQPRSEIDSAEQTENRLKGFTSISHSCLPGLTGHSFRCCYGHRRATDGQDRRQQR